MPRRTGRPCVCGCVREKAPWTSPCRSEHETPVGGTLSRPRGLLTVSSRLHLDRDRDSFLWLGRTLPVPDALRLLGGQDEGGNSLPGEVEMEITDNARFR